MCIKPMDQAKVKAQGFSQVFLKIYFIDYAITVVPISPFIPLHPALPLPPTFPPISFMSMGNTYKFLGFSISYTILNLPLSILYLPFMLLIPWTFSPILPLPCSPLITIQMISISVILFLFQLFAQLVFVCFFFRFS